MSRAIIRWLIPLALMVLLCGCLGAVRGKAPDVVTVTVEKILPLPAWATARLEKPMPVDGTVGARSRSHDQRGNVIDYANCRSSLLERLGKGEKVSQDECEL